MRFELEGFCSYARLVLVLVQDITSMPRTVSWLLRSEARFRAAMCLVLLASACVVAVVVAAFVISFGWPSPAIATPEEHFLAGRAEDFKVAEPVYFKAGDFWLVRRPDASFVAFYARDTRGWLRDGKWELCEVRWLPDYSYVASSGPERRGGFKVDSKCSSSAFDIDGRRVFGPSPRNLDSRPVRVSSTGNVVVDIAKHHLNKGDEYQRRP